MMVRSWRGHARPENVAAYVAHATSNVFPQLEALAGFRGALVLQRPEGAEVEILVQTFWESRAAIQAFAGADIAIAVVEPEARAVLTRFETTAQHHEVVEMLRLGA